MSDWQKVTRARRADFKTREDGEDLIIEGYFIVFNQPYSTFYGVEEYVDPHAIDENTDTSDVRALTDHLSHLVLGRSTAGTLTWSIDDVGLFGTIPINRRDLDAVNLHARVQRGDVDQASFGFDEDDVEWIDLPDGRVQRIIRHISKLWEISVCTFPAYEQTSVSARDRDSAAQLKDELAAHKKENLKRRFKHHA